VTRSNSSILDARHHTSPGDAPFFQVYFDLALILVVIAAAVIVFFVPVADIAPARLIAGLALIFFIPGYAVLAVIFPLKADITHVERVGFSLVLSIIIVGGMSFLASYTPLGLRAAPVVAVVSILVLVITVSAYVRRRSLPLERRFAISVPRTSGAKRAPPWGKLDGKLEKTLAVVLVLVSVVALSATIYLIAAPTGGEAYTAFYVLGPDGKAQDYPSQFRLGEEQSVIVGVTNHEQRAMDYTLVTTLSDNVSSSTLSTETLHLANNENWEQPMNVRPDRIGEDMQLSFLLYGYNDTTPLQTTHLWVNVTA
jgi:uncharacterized membrane protein